MWFSWRHKKKIWDVYKLKTNFFQKFAKKKNKKKSGTSFLMKIIELATKLMTTWWYDINMLPVLGLKENSHEMIPLLHPN